MLEEPVNSGAHSFPTAEIPLPKKCFNLAWPVDLARDMPRVGTQLLLARMITRSVRSNVKPRRTRRQDQSRPGVPSAGFNEPSVQVASNLPVASDLTSI